MNLRSTKLTFTPEPMPKKVQEFVEFDEEMKEEIIGVKVMSLNEAPSNPLAKVSEAHQSAEEKKDT